MNHEYNYIDSPSNASREPIQSSQLLLPELKNVSAFEKLTAWREPKSRIFSLWLEHESGSFRGYGISFPSPVTKPSDEPERSCESSISHYPALTHRLYRVYSPTVLSKLA